MYIVRSIYIRSMLILLGPMQFIQTLVTYLESMIMHWTMMRTPHHHHVPHGPLLEGLLSFLDIYLYTCGFLCLLYHICGLFEVVGSVMKWLQFFMGLYWFVMTSFSHLLKGLLYC
jgi:hypothetical protein